jgi:hypothetical protein
VSHVRKQIRAAAVTVLTGLATTGSRVYPSVVYPMQDAQLPGLRIDTGAESIAMAAPSGGVARTHERTLNLIVQGCVKQNTTYNDVIDAIAEEVEKAIANNQSLGGAKYVQLKSIEVALSGDGEHPVAVSTMTFEVFYYTAMNAPDASA